MRSDAHKYWFPAKKYGWGWGVANCWQGALVQLSYPVLIAIGAWHFMPQRQVAAFLTFCAVLTVLFLAIHWVKGERPHWRWGD